MNIKTRFLLGIVSFLLTFQPAGYVFAENQVGLKGKLEVNDCCVTVVNPDGSIVNLDVGATYPLFPESILITDETGEVELKVPDGRYVIRKNSEYRLTDIGAGNTGLVLPDGKIGEVCYCFSPEGQFLIDEPANTEDWEGQTTAAATEGGYTRYDSLGIAIFRNGITYTLQLDGVAEFDTKRIDAGDAVCKPQCDNPYEPFDDRSPCCPPDLLPVWLGGAAAAAAVTGGILGGIPGGDSEGSDFLPAP